MASNLLIFDMDGVLVDVSKSYRLAIKETAEFFSKDTLSFKEIQGMKNIGGYNNDWDLTEGLLLARGISISKSQIISKFQELYLGNNFDGYIKNEEWLLKMEILNRLSNGYNLAIVTGRPKREAEHAISTFKVRRHFRHIVTMDDVPSDKQKPNPFGLKGVLEAFKVDNAIYFGDTIDDMRMALSAGLRPIGVIPPGQDGNLKEILLESGAETVLDDINKVEEVLK